MSLQTKIESIVGSQSDVAALTDWLQAGAKYITNILPEQRVEKYTVDLTDAGSGISVLLHKVFGAHKSNYGARRVSSSLAAQVANTSSIYYAGTTDPVWYILNGLAYVKPSGGTVRAMAYPLPLYTDSVITGFPLDLEYGVILYAAIQARLRQLSDLAMTTIGGLSFTEQVAPTAPTSPSFTYEDVSYSDASYTDAEYTAAIYINALIDTITSTVVGDLSDAPVYNKSVMSMSTAPSALDLSGITLPTAPTDFSLTAVVPTAPDDATYSYSDATLGTYTATTIASTEVAPEYIPAVTAFDLTNASSYIASEEDLEKASTEISKQATLLEQYGKDLYNELNEYNKELEVYKGVLGKEIEQARLDQERLIATANKTTDLSVQNEAKTIEAEIQLYASKLQKYQGEISSYGAEVNAKINAYQQLLQKFSGQLNLAKTNVDQSVQEYRANMEVWQSERQSELSQYSVDIQNELNEFNKNKAFFDVDFQKVMADAQLAQQRLIEQTRNQIELNKFNASQAVQEALANAAQGSQVDLANRRAALELSITNKSKTLETAIINEAKGLEKQIQEYQSKLALYGQEIGVYSTEIQQEVSKKNFQLGQYSTQSQIMLTGLQALRNEFTEFIKII